jgi:hypothetical protein
MTTQTLEWTDERNGRLYSALVGGLEPDFYDVAPDLTDGDGMLWVLEQMHAKGWGLRGSSDTYGAVAMFVNNGPPSLQTAATLPLAVALAAESALQLK